MKITMIRKTEKGSKASDAVSGSASVSNARGLGLEPCQLMEKDFRVRMRRPDYFGLVTLTSFG
jgi:hypothetical protein